MNDDLNKSPLASALRGLRRQRGWTLAEVSQRTGFSVPTLSKVENGRMSLSYDKLIRLSEGLGVDIAQLFASSDPAGAAAIGGRRSINRQSEGDFVPTRNYDYHYLHSDVVRKKFIPILSEPRAQTVEEFGELVKHSGEEFVYVLEGEVEVHTEAYKPFVLRAGESAYLDSSMGHAYIARTTPCKVLGVCSATESQLRESVAREREQAKASQAPRAAAVKKRAARAKRRR